MLRETGSYFDRHLRLLSVLLIALALFIAPVNSAGAVAPQKATGTYTNPLPIQIPGDGMVESCADPSLIKGQQPGDNYWYMYCTTDPLNDQDKTGDKFNFRLIPMLRSEDLVNWTYMGDAFTTRPAWIGDNTGMWAPEIQFFNGQYYLYYTAPETDLPGGGSAIGVAISDNPLGPWTDSGGPVVEPHAPACCPDAKRWTFDPEVVITATGQKYIFYGSYFGGISARTLSPDGLHSDPASQTQITIANRYEGPEVVYKDGYYYLFVSATDCCRGPLTGYAVFVGRSANILGPYVDRDGASLLAGRVGGTPVITQNGNEWVGTGHNSVFQDAAGRFWTVYHAVNRYDPYFEGAPGFTKRPVLMDPLDWVKYDSGWWPVLNGGEGPSNNPQHAPAAQPGDKSTYKTKLAKEEHLGKLRPELSDEFNSASLDSDWSWVRQPAAGTYGLTGSAFRFNTQAADLYVDSNNASVLTMDAPNGNYTVETKVMLNVPPEGCCFNYTQAGLVIYGDDDNFIKLVHFSLWDTRQTEFAKEVYPVPAGYPRYGNTVVGPPGDWTYLRISKRTHAGEEHYTAYTSRDGVNWVKGGTWTHELGKDSRIGLVSMGGSGFTATFDYVRVYR